MEKKKFDMVLLPPGAIILTKKEREALDEYSEKLKRETIEAIFGDVEELLQMALKTEIIKAKHSYEHKYSKCLCQDLISDLKKIERKYKE